MTGPWLGWKKKQQATLHVVSANMLFIMISDIVQSSQNMPHLFNKTLFSGKANVCFDF